MPSLVNYLGFVAGDNANNSISVWAMAKLNVSDSNTPGTSPITFAVEATLISEKEKNYTLKHENGTLTVNPGRTVTVQNNGHGRAFASLDSAGAGAVITLTALPDEGYRLKEWQVISGGVTIDGNQFTMFYENVTIKAIFESIPGASYKVTVNNGTASPTIAVAGIAVTLTANTAPGGQRFKEWTVQSGGVALANPNAATTTFTMPVNAVEVTATYEEIPVSVTPVMGITLSPVKVSLYSNTTPRTADLRATVVPFDAADKTVTWQSTNTVVATVDTNGKVTAAGNGTAVITATTTDGGHTASCTVTVTTYSSSGSGSGGSSSSGGSTAVPAVPISSNVSAGGSVSQSVLSSELAQALSQATGMSATVRTRNAQSISPKTLRKLASDAAAKGKTAILHADTMLGTAVQGRLYIEPAKLTTALADIQLGVYTEPAKTLAVTKLFQNYFDNPVHTVYMEQQGGFGERLEVAAKVDLTGLNMKTLVFYSYDAKTNTYFKITDPSYRMDASGYLHFYTNLAGSIVIADKPLSIKK